MSTEYEDAFQFSSDFDNRYGCIVFLGWPWRGLRLSGGNGFFNLSPDVMRPAALIMNIFVASLVLWHLSRERIFNWRLFLPIAIGSIPFAIIGGGITLDESHYKWLIGCLLVLAAVLMIFRIPAHERTVPVKPWLALLFGALLGFVSGLTGVGGGSIR